MKPATQSNTRPSRPGSGLRPRANLRARAAGFTLIELILVMALLLIVLAVSAPSLYSFFRGRSLDSEAKRLLALTRYAQSRAASEGVPMALWIDPDDRTYGLQTDGSYEDDDKYSKWFTLRDDLEVSIANVNGAKDNKAWRSTSNTMPGNRQVIKFLPDGTLGDDAPDRIIVSEDKENSVALVKSRNRMSYETELPFNTSSGR